MNDDLVKRLRERSLQYVDNEYNLDKRAADRIEQLEAANLKQLLITVDHLSRIEKLEAALQKIIALGFWDGDSARDIAREALDAK